MSPAYPGLSEEQSCPPGCQLLAHRLAESALDPIIFIINKDIKQNWPQYQSLRYTTSCQLLQATDR